MTLAGAVEILEERRSPAASASAGSSPSEVVTKPAIGKEHISQLGKDAASINVYQLTSRKMFRYQESIERRALKNSLSDRRAEPRLTASGEIQPDRRASNRAANIELFKKAG